MEITYNAIYSVQADILSRASTS